MGALLFSHFRVTNVKLMNENFWMKKIVKYYSFKLTWTASFYYVFLYLACFLVSTYVTFIWVIWILMAYVQQQIASSTTYLFTRSQKTFSRFDPKVYINITEGKWTFFIWNGLMVDRLTGPRLVSLWSAWDWC